LLWRTLWPCHQNKNIPSLYRGRSIHHVFWARNAIYHGLKALGVSPGDHILVPSFHCASAIEPILSLGATADFYNIRRDCSPDFADIEAKINKHTRAILAIHYFGFPQPMRKFTELCQHHQLDLIEDCAHVLVGQAEGQALGTFGDVSVFSWRKFLPVYDGGHLVINSPRICADIPWERNTLLFSLKVTKNTFAKLLDDSANGAVKIVSDILHLPSMIARRLLSTESCQPKAFAINNYGLNFDLAAVNLRMSRVSKYLMHHMDISAIVEKRRANYLQLLKAVTSLPAITPFFPYLPEGICPWVFPVLTHEVKDLHVILRAKGIPAFTWGGVIHPELSIEDFPDAAFLYENLVLLPVHQSIGVAEIHTMTEIMSEVLQHGC
jgi:dTDP-4-amino-4,6-dideoxygalactose transaminase